MHACQEIIVSSKFVEWTQHRACITPNSIAMEVSQYHNTQRVETGDNAKEA